MSKAWLVASLVAGTLALTVVDLDACGDKFMRLGRGSRFRGYAAMHKAEILIYRPAGATAASVKDLETLLKRAGHRTSVLERGTPLGQATVSADLIIAAYPDAVTLREHIRTIPSPPDVLPVLHKATKELDAEAHRQFSHLLIPQAMSNVDALAEIDSLMQQRREASAARANGG